VQGLLDVGCGGGYFSRVLGANGAARGVGCEVPPDLIKDTEEQDPQGEYRVFDVKSGAPDVGAWPRGRLAALRTRVSDDSVTEAIRAISFVASAGEPEVVASSLAVSNETAFADWTPSRRELRLRVRAPVALGGARRDG
jgi:hypothetical protein